VANLPAGDLLGAADFGLKAGNDNTPGGWADAPAPLSVTVRRGAGAGGSDRVTLVFADGAIRDQWLQVTVKANARTGLAAPDVFYFGNLIGETNDNPASATVNALDLAAVKRVLGASNVGLSNAFDFDRDGRVNALDLAAVKGRLGKSLAMSSAPAAPAPAGAVAPASTFGAVPVSGADALAVAHVWDEPTADVLGR